MKKTNNVKAIVFDLDDTLFPEKEFAMSGFKTVSAYLSQKYKMKEKEIFNIFKKDFDSGLRHRNFNLLLKKLKINENIDNLIKIYRNHKPHLSLFSDAKKILDYLQKKGFKLALISDGNVKTQKNKIDALKIKKYFKIITLTDSLGKRFRKPHKRPFEIILKKLNVYPRQALYIADNPLKDFITPKKLGILTVRIKRDGGEYNHIKTNKKNKANLTINSLLELKSLIKSQSNG